MNEENINCMVNNIRIFLEQQNLLNEFKNHTPTQTTGYVYDTSPLIENLKLGVYNDRHSDASFAVCCKKLKELLDNNI
tara:strand:- start:5852 stop:6085 length:234 start_codon:yes stop_codon:yes gene_type:complete